MTLIELLAKVVTAHDLLLPLENCVVDAALHREHHSAEEKNNGELLGYLKRSQLDLLKDLNFRHL